MAVFVGLDCGGSSTRVLAVDDSGKAVYRGQSGPANLLSTPADVLERSLAAATRECPSPDSVCGCFAGLVDSGTRAKALALLKRVLPGANTYRAEPDYAAALAACGPEAEACVIAGTGSIVCSWRKRKLAKSGGRGPILGDPGSAAEIGREMLSRFLDDPKSVGNSFHEAVCEAFGSAAETEIITSLYNSASPARLLAQLAKAAATEASDGSESARFVIEREMNALADLLARHFRRYGTEGDAPRVGLSGGLWKSGTLFVQEFRTALNQHSQTMNVNTFVLRRPPIEGAAQLAKEAALGN